MGNSGLTKPLPGVPSSAEIREQLAGEERPVCVAFSGGKDAIATALALKDAGVETILVHLYLIPGKVPGETLGFVEDGLKAIEDHWQQQIYRYPHPSFYRMLNNLVFQAPENCALIEAARLPTPDYETMWQAIRVDLGLAEDTWVADGVRASDSLVRRSSIKRHGAIKPGKRKVSPIWDWLQGKVYDYIEQSGTKLPVDYEWFGRSFDGIDYRFTKPLYEHAPEDYKQIKKWFPLVDLELMRHGVQL